MNNVKAVELNGAARPTGQDTARRFLAAAKRVVALQCVATASALAQVPATHEAPIPPSAAASAPVAAALAPQRIDIPTARFARGDDPSWAQPGFDDSTWALLNTTRAWEMQGHDGYDGFAWYRLHVRIPSALKAASDWPERLRIYLATIGDADEVYLNGTPVGKTGRLPNDSAGFENRWQTPRDYLVDLSSGAVRWDADNVIAVRVYDSAGSGGLLGPQTPFVAVPLRAEGLQMDPARAQHRFLPGENVAVTLTVANRFPVQQQGELHLQARDLASGRRVMLSQQRVLLEPGQSTHIEMTLPSRPGIEARFRYVDEATGYEIESSHVVPYVLTPPDAATPALHGARLLGARPGTPLVHRVPAIGRPPLRFSAEGLPAGLQLDVNTGVIRGTVPPAGSYTVKLTVSNALGSAQRDWTLVSGEQLALTPALGWNSWNAFGTAVSDADVRQAARVFVDQGLAAKGWSSLHIDDGWQAAARSADGSLRGNARFPDMPALAAHLHSLGLRLGLYASPGPSTCGRFPGSFAHELQDAATWAAWGVDHLKYELCSYADKLPARPTLDDHQKPFRFMGQALRQQPRSIAYNLSQYGGQKVWTWGADAGAQSWRMTGDIQDSWADLLVTGFALAPYVGFAGPGRHNDPDVLMLGQIGVGDPRPTRLTADEQYTQVSLWSLLAAPMLLSNQLTTLDEFTRSLLTNSEVLAIHQDALSLSARRVLDRGDWQVWVKDLEGGGKAVGVFNMGRTFGSFQLDPALVGHGAPRYVVRDVWRQKDLPPRTTPLPLAVPSHGVVLLTVR